MSLSLGGMKDIGGVFLCFRDFLCFRTMDICFVVLGDLMAMRRGDAADTFGASANSCCKH